MGQPLAIVSTGLVTAVGLSAPASCAAIRAKVANSQELRFMDSGGEWMTGCPVPLEQPWRGPQKLVAMATRAITECLEDVARSDWAEIPLVLCVAEKSRPGRTEGLDDRLYLEIEAALETRFAQGSGVVALGRVSIAAALEQARRLIYEMDVPRVLIAATDSLLSWPQLSVFERNNRVLTSRNSNGFIPGEAAGAILVARPISEPTLICTGVGLGFESATIESEEPLRGDGLVQAVTAALAEASCAWHELDWRITDNSGEQYYFKEAALLLRRLMRNRREQFDIWHAAQCTGEVGAAAGAVALAMADAAWRKSYAPGLKLLFHASNDAGERGGVILTYGAH